MQLEKLLKNLRSCKVYGSTKIEIDNIVDDSRKAKRKSLFVAIKGIKVDAHQFIQEAIKKGSVAVIGEKKPIPSWLKKISYIRVENTRKALSLIASQWFENPSKKLKIIGVTGTDGKTTTASLIAWIMRRNKKKVGLITTIEARIGDEKYDTGFHVTNPEPLALQRLLKMMVDKRCEYAVLEVTSHGIEQERVHGIKFLAGVLTNVTREHLDYHKTFKNYLSAKQKLFKNVSIAVLNRDDSYYNSFSCVVPSGAKIVSYSLNNLDTDLRAENIKYNIGGSQFNVLIKNGSEWKRHFLKSKLIGDYNVSNILAALGLALSLGLPFEKIKDAVANFYPPRGRLQSVPNNKGIKIYIDFAHTPNSLEKVLLLLKSKTQGKLISVLGCAGERDTTKRPKMGEISVKIADISIFTAEDPRSEDVNKIIEQMVQGAKKIPYSSEKTMHYCNALQKQSRGLRLDKIKERYYLRIPERGEAISFALQRLAKEKDTVVVFGKGHEKSMAYNGIEYPWSDYEAVESALKGKVKKIIRTKK